MHNHVRILQRTLRIDYSIFRAKYIVSHLAQETSSSMGYLINPGDSHRCRYSDSKW